MEVICSKKISKIPGFGWTVTLCSLLDCSHVYHRFSCLAWPGWVLWPVADRCGFKVIRHFSVKRQLYIWENIKCLKVLRFGDCKKLWFSMHQCSEDMSCIGLPLSFGYIKCSLKPGKQLLIGNTNSVSKGNCQSYLQIWLEIQSRASTSNIAKTYF